MTLKILVTGGSGFIGSNLIQFYLKGSIHVLNLDRYPPNKSDEIKYWKKQDILDYEGLKVEVLKFKPNVVFHLAARTDLKGKRIGDYDENTIGTHNLIKVLNKVNSVNKVVFCSSMLVCYPGYLPKHPTDFSPSTVYGKSKVKMEMIIRESKHNYDWVIVRPTSIWGPGFDEPYKYFFQRIINKGYFHIGGKECEKTYGFIDNVIYQLDSINKISFETINGDVFYLGDYNSTNIKDWANEIAQKLGYKIITVPFVFIKIAAIFGDLLTLFNIQFPITSFRLNNMTTDNVLDISNTEKIAPDLPYSRIKGVEKTLEWMSE